MTRDEAVETIKRGLTFRTGTTVDDNIVFELKQAQRRVENGEAVSTGGRRPPLPWFLAAEDVAIGFVANNPEADLSEGFLAEMEGEGPYYLPTDNVNPIHLRKWNPEAPRRSASDFSLPSFYQIRLETIKVFPTPLIAMTLYWSYFKADDSLDTDIENKWLRYAPQVLIGLAGQQIAADMKNASAVEKFTVMYSQAIDGLELQNFRRLYNNQRSQMGGG